MALGSRTPVERLTPIKVKLDRIPITRIAILGLVGFAVLLVLGEASLFLNVKSIDRALFDLIVPSVQSIPGVVPTCVQLTKVGEVPVSYGMAFGIGLYSGLQRRSIFLPVAAIGSLFAGHLFQLIVHRIVQGYAPTDFAIGGSAGPFFSGGVMRVILLVGIAATLALPPTKDRLVWSLAMGFGAFQGFTRLVLGRHWPLDIVAGFVVGLGLLWLFRQAVEHRRDVWRTRSSDR